MYSEKSSISSSLGIDSNQKAIKTSLALGTSQTNDLNQVSSVYNYSNDNLIECKENIKILENNIN